jgi:hypothetical protein
MAYTYEDVMKIVSDLKNNLTDIKDTLKTGNISDDLFGVLSNKAKKVQDKLDVLLNQKGILTQTDIDEAYRVARETQKNELANASKKATKKAIIYLGIVAIIIGGLLYYKRKKG